MSKSDNHTTASNISSDGAGPVRRTWLHFYPACVLAGLAGVAGSFHEFLRTGGNHIAGNFGDARLIVYLLEHWFKTFRGHEAWMSPPFFYPVADIFGYSHTLLLQALPYTAFRLLGADSLISFELTLITFALIGYAFTVRLLRQLDIEPAFAIVGGVLYAFSNIFHIWALAPQSYNTMLIPLVLSELVSGVRNGGLQDRRSTMSIARAGVMLCLILYSDFYTGWFFLAYACVYALLFFTVARRNVPAWARGLCVRPRALVTVTVSILVALVPLVVTYAPVIGAGKFRTLGDVMGSLLSAADIINVNSGNVVWGWFLNGLRESYHNIGWAYGIPPTMVVGFLAVSGYLAVRGRVPGTPGKDRRIMLIRCAAISVLIVWLCIFKPTGTLLWPMVWRVVPGAKAIRVIPRFQFVLSLFVVITVVFGLSLLWRAACRGGGGLSQQTQRLLRCLVIAVTTWLIVEQASTTKTHYVVRSEELSRISAAGRPSFFCDSFFIQESAGPPSHPIGLQVDAMLISQSIGLPTINGYSGFSPDEWALNDPHDPAYLDKVDSWMTTHKLANVCAYDVATGHWIQKPFAGRARIAPDMEAAVVLKAADPRLYSRVGVKSAEAIASTGKGGWLEYGPYLPAKKGEYVATWYGRLLKASPSPGAVEVAVNGKRVVAAALSKDLPVLRDGVLARLRFSLQGDVKDLQCVMAVNDGVLLEIRHITIDAARDGQP